MQWDTILRLLEIDYSLTRPFPWRWYGPLVHALAFISIIFLCLLNVALTGYETITVFRTEFTTEPLHWYERIAPRQTQEVCSPQVINIGDTMTTNYSIFKWQLDSIIVDNEERSGLSYNGTLLTNCDVSTVFLTGDLRTRTTDIQASIVCKNGSEYEVTAFTKFPGSNLPVSRTPLGVLNSQLPGRLNTVRTRAISDILFYAGTDAADRLARAFKYQNSSSFVLISAQADFEYCPASLGTSAPCATDVPRFNMSNCGVVFPDGSFDLISLDYALPGSLDIWLSMRDILAPGSNMFRIIHAAARLDLGNPSPNNFFLDPSVAKSQLITSFPHTPASPTPELSTSLLTKWIDDPEHAGIPQLNATGPGIVKATYLCQVQQRKSAGQLVISVLVATLSMFSSGWAILMTISSFVARQTHSGANVCNGHCDQWHQVENPDYNFSSGSFRLHRRLEENHNYDPVRTVSDQFVPFENEALRE